MPTLARDLARSAVGLSPPGDDRALVDRALTDALTSTTQVGATGAGAGALLRRRVPSGRVGAA